MLVHASRRVGRGTVVTDGDDTGRQLVEQQDSWPADEGERHEQALELPAGQHSDVQLES